jgi:Fe2+ transport system protein FeoA
MNKKGDTMCLTHIEAGSKVLVHNLNAGHRFRHHMAEMGIFPGAMIKVLKKESQGPLLVQIGHSRLMLGRRMAEKITVK